MKKACFLIDYSNHTLIKERKTNHKNVAQENEKAISGVIKIDENKIRTRLDGLVRHLFEDTLNALWDAEVDAIRYTNSTTIHLYKA